MSGTSNGNQPNPRRVAHRRRAGAPPVDINIDPADLDDLQAQMAEFPDLLAILSFNGGRAVDGNYGDRTYRAILQIAIEAGIVRGTVEHPENPEVISQINFRGKTGDLYTRWNTALQNHHKENETPQQVVDRVEQRTGATAEDLAAIRRAAQEAERAAAERAASDARVDAAIRGTAYDPRNLPSATTPQGREARRALIIRGLFALDELKDDDLNRRHDHDKIFDKMAETIRRVNREAGRTVYPELQEHDDPLSDNALAALGRRVAMAGGIRGVEESVYQRAAGQSQQQLDAAAAIGLHALDRTAGITRDPEILRREIRQFEREVMRLSNVEADGVADDAMIRALEEAVRARGGLVQVTGVQAVTATATDRSPAQTPVRPATDTQDQSRQPR